MQTLLQKNSFLINFLKSREKRKMICYVYKSEIDQTHRVHFWWLVESPDASRSSLPLFVFVSIAWQWSRCYRNKNGLANRDARSRGATMLTHIRWVTRTTAGLNDQQHQTFIYMPTVRPENIVPQVHIGDPDPPQRQYSTSASRLTFANYREFAIMCASSQILSQSQILGYISLQ